MRKTLGLLLVLVLIASPLSAFAAAKLDTALIGTAKQALSLMSYGEYKKAVKKLNFSKNAPSASGLSDFVENDLSDLPYVALQTDVAVAYLSGSSWRIAVPIEEPCYDTVRTLVLRSKDGKTFDNYKAMDWYEVVDEVALSEKVVWQNEYSPGELYLVSDESF